MTDARITPSLALAAYAEGWISGTKVVVFGDASSVLAERLLERGARHVQVYDSDPVRVAEATASSKNRQIAYAPLDQAGTLARDGSFDFGIIEDLALAGANAEDWLGRMRRALSKRGLGLVASQNPDVARHLLRPAARASRVLGYYELYDLISQHFDEVRMLGQTAFVGYAIADFSATEEPEVRIDTAFVPGGAEEPEWFLALVSALPATAEAFSVIQLPFAELSESEPRDDVEDRALAPAVEVPQAKPDDSELIALRTELAKREEWLRALESRASTADQRADDMQSELDQKSSEIADAKREVTQAKREAADAKREAADAKRKAVELEREAADTKREAAEAKREAADTKREAVEAKREAAEAKREGTDAKREGTDAKREGTDAKREIERLTARLEAEQRAQRERGDSSRALELELGKARKSLETEAAKLRKLEEQLRALELTREATQRELETLRQRPAPDEEAQTELRQLESQIAERAVEVQRLTEALHQTERFGRQLIIEVEQLKAAARIDTASRDLAKLAQRNAELEADLEAARWTISSLETNVSESPISPAAGVPAQRRDEVQPTNAPST